MEWENYRGMIVAYGWEGERWAIYLRSDRLREVWLGPLYPLPHEGDGSYEAARAVAHDLVDGMRLTVAMIKKAIYFGEPYVSVHDTWEGIRLAQKGGAGG